MPILQQRFSHRHHSRNISSMVPGTERMPPKVKWHKSHAKEILADDVRHGVVTSDLNPRDVYHMHGGIFLAYEFKNFKNNLNTLLKSHISNQNLASFDSEALVHDMKLHQPSMESTSTEWNGSDAQKSLRADMDLQRHKILSPKDLWNTRPEYKRFALKVFRDHIYQEERRCGSAAFWQTTKKKKK